MRFWKAFVWITFAWVLIARRGKGLVVKKKSSKESKSTSEPHRLEQQSGPV